MQVLERTRTTAFSYFAETAGGGTLRFAAGVLGVAARCNAEGGEAWEIELGVAHGEAGGAGPAVRVRTRGRGRGLGSGRDFQGGDARQAAHGRPRARRTRHGNSRPRRQRAVGYAPNAAVRAGRQLEGTFNDWVSRDYAKFIGRLEDSFRPLQRAVQFDNRGRPLDPR